MNKFSLGEKVWCLGWVSGIKYPAVVIGLPRPTRLRLRGGAVVDPYIMAYQLRFEDGFPDGAAPERNLRPRYDGENTIAVREQELEIA
jgi:hypothetical protein